MKIPKSGLFVDKAADTEITPATEIPSTVEGEAPTIVPATIKEGEWFYTLVASNGNVIAENYGLNTSQTASKTIKAVRNWFNKHPNAKVYNKVTGESKPI